MGAAGTDDVIAAAMGIYRFHRKAYLFVLRQTRRLLWNENAIGVGCVHSYGHKPPQVQFYEHFRALESEITESCEKSRT
jgi:hypothetical protein